MKPEHLQVLKDFHSDVVSLVECIEEVEDDGGVAYDTLKTRKLLGLIYELIQHYSELEPGGNNKRWRH